MIPRSIDQAAAPVNTRGGYLRAVGTDKLTGGYGIAKVRHEDAWKSGPIPVVVVRAAQFHEFVEQLVAWGTRGEVAKLLIAVQSGAHARVLVHNAGGLVRVGGEDADSGQVTAVAGGAHYREDPVSVQRYHPPLVRPDDCFSVRHRLVPAPIAEDRDRVSRGGLPPVVN